MTTTITSAPPSSAFMSTVDSLHARLGGPIASAGGVILASHNALPDAEWQPLHRFGLAVARGPAATPETLERFALELLAAHRAVLHRALEHAIRHLDARTSAGTTLLSKQLVQGDLANIALALNESDVRAGLGYPIDAAARWRMHHELVAIGRAVMRLLGASGFLAEGFGADLHLAEITGNVYLYPGA